MAVDPALEPDWERNRVLYRNDATARRYDQLRYLGWRKWLKNKLHSAVLRRAFRDVPPGARVLDAPCGTGRFTRWAAGAGYRVVGADISANMLLVARENAEGPASCGFVAADVLRLPYDDQTFDATLTVRFFHLVPRDVRPKVYAELARVSRGQVILCLNCDRWALKHVVRRMRGFRSSYWMNRRELKAELAGAGLDVERIHTKASIFSTLWVVVCRPRGRARA